MAKYMAKENICKELNVITKGQIVEIDRLPQPIILADKKYHYSIPNVDVFFTKTEMRKQFVKVRKSNPLIRNLLIIAVWELGKYLGEQLVIYTERNDDVDIPSDFNILDHKHLNEVVE